MPGEPPTTVAFLALSLETIVSYVRFGYCNYCRRLILEPTCRAHSAPLEFGPVGDLSPHSSERSSHHSLRGSLLANLQPLEVYSLQEHGNAFASPKELLQQASELPRGPLWRWGHLHLQIARASPQCAPEGDGLHFLRLDRSCSRFPQNRPPRLGLPGLGLSSFSPCVRRL